MVKVFSPCALLAAELGRALTGRVHKYMGRVGGVLVPVAISRGCLTWIPEFIPHTLRPALLEPQGAVPPLSRGARFIVWCLRCPFLREYRRSSKCFWNRRACVAYGPASGSHSENGIVPNSHIREVLEKYLKVRDTCDDHEEITQ